jgi:hypothetical protein
MRSGRKKSDFTTASVLILSAGCLGISPAGSCAGMTPAYAVVISSNSWADPGWRSVAEVLQKKHNAEIIRYGTNLADTLVSLQQSFPARVCFVAPPAEATRSFVAEVHRLTRALDEDPYPDCFWGILTGYDAPNAMEIALQREPLVIRKVLSATPIPLHLAREGVWFSELKAGQVMRKLAGGAPAEETGPSDSTESLAKTLVEYQPELFITSGHATERDWQIGFSYRNGSFRCENGALYALDTTGRKIAIQSANPKVYLAVGNCLMGHVDSTNAMALAFMKAAEVRQMIGYTVNTWYGYAGWGCLDYFYEQPGRYSLAAAFAANNAALVHRLQQCFPELLRETLDLNHPSRPTVKLSPAATQAGLTAQDGYGLLYDRDAVAFYGDPALDARLAPGPLAWDQTLALGQEKNTWIFEIRPRLGDRSFAAVDKNGSQRGGRPFVEFFPRRLGRPRLLEGADLNPVITDSFILVPNPGKCDPAGSYRVVFEAAPARP